MSTSGSWLVTVKGFMGFLELAAAEPERYVVVSAQLPADEVHAAVAARVLPVLPEPALVGA